MSQFTLLDFYWAFGLVCPLILLKLRYGMFSLAASIMLTRIITFWKIILHPLELTLNFMNTS